MNQRDSTPEPRISAVIPVFNRERTIGRAVESVLAQSRSAAEIVVVDDGSTDRTAEAAAVYADHVRYVRQANAGAAVARNRGVESATARWVAFLDSDDYWFADHLDRMASAITATAGVAGFYFVDSRRPDTKDRASLWELSGFAVPECHRLVDDATDWVLMDIQPMMLQSSVFNRDLYIAAGGLWPALRIREDTHLYFVMGIGGSACAVAQGGVQMTSDDDSGRRLTEEYGPATREWWFQTRQMYADVLQRFPGLAESHRRRLRSRLATAHVRLGQDALHSRRQVGLAARHLVQSAWVAPGHIATSALRWGSRTAGHNALTRRALGGARAGGRPGEST